MEKNNTLIEIKESTFEEIYTIESLLEILQETLLNLELNSQYYNANENITIKISKERNKYINLIKLAKFSANKIENLSNKLEEYVLDQ